MGYEGRDVSKMKGSEWRSEREVGGVDMWRGDENGSPLTGGEGGVGKKWWKDGVGGCS